MFGDTILAAMSLAFPDVCKILVVLAPVPTPLLNMMFSTTRLPMVFNVIIGGGMSLNMLGVAVVSTGNEAGFLLGVVSQLIVGPGRVVVASVKLFLACIPATRMTGVTAQNGLVPNAAGVTLTPSQIIVIVIM